MCGIAGKLYLDGQQPVERNLIKRMMDVVAHRGPDGEGQYVVGPVGLGHRRLSIIDLSPAGKQPMSNEEGTVWVTYNGEIYNFRELREELISRGHIFKSKTDTEVLVHGYEEWGMESLLSRINGMFAFAIWDAGKQMLSLARDRVGIKPLYYTNTGKALLFASEIKSMIVDPSVVRRMSVSSIDRFLTYYYLPGNETLFEGIYKLDPGHYLTVHNGQIRKHQYWDLRFEVSPRWTRFDEAVEVLQELLHRCVKNHMISDVPVGVLLSGGVDSTGVLHYATEQHSQQIRTFTVGFEGEDFSDERPYATLAARRYGSLHQDISMNAKDFIELLPKYIWHMEEPVCEPPAIALYLVSRLARESSIKVLLSGEGGDEAFGGYQTYRNLLLFERLKAALGPAKGILRVGLHAFGQLGWKRAARYSNLVDIPLSQYYFSRTSTPNTAFNQLKRSIYTKEFSDNLDAKISNAPTRYLFENHNSHSWLNQMLYVDTKTWLPDDLLVKADKMTMATSVELRVPLLDYKLLEFAASLPENYKVRGWHLKRILKTALKNSVPRKILDRKKTGFPVPYDRWLREKMRDYVFDTLLGQNAAIGDYFNKTKIKYIIEAHRRGEGYSNEVFSLIVIELWLKIFIERNPAYDC